MGASMTLLTYRWAMGEACLSLGLRVCEAHCFELFGLGLERPLDGEALHARRAVEPVQTVGAPQHVLGIGGLGDRTAVAEHDHVGPHLPRRAGPLVDVGDA